MNSLPVSSRLRSLFFAGAALCALAACQDAPTSPQVFTHPADGTLWVAIIAPAGIPDAKSWHPYVKAASARATLNRIDALHAEALKARRLGDFETARVRAHEANELAARSITRMPSPVTLLSAIAGLDQWAERAETALLEHQLPRLDSAVVEVKAARKAAHAALQAGDTVAAVIHLSEAGERVREHSPPAVALQALAHTERRLAAGGLSNVDAARSLRLVRSAREALLAGDEVRALQRALYALQIAEQKEVSGASPTAKKREE